MMLRKSFLFFMVLLLTACGGDGSDEVGSNSIDRGGAAEESIDTVISIPTQDRNVTILGEVTYDFVPFKSGGVSGLDYNNIVQKPVRGAVVEIVDGSGKVLGRGSTDVNGNYSIDVEGTIAKVRVYARLYQELTAKKASWDFQVKDNTNANALYVMEGALVGLGENSTQTRNLNAASGWDGTRYSSTRVAAPFAILDVVYEAVQKVVTAQNDAQFGSLDIFWSKNNIAASGSITLGEITTSHYDGKSLYILGAENSDTDEYDRAVVAHEWGHYYEDKFSRSDSIGGAHGRGDMLDIRVAFGEGFGTALGCIIIDNPLYLDSSGRGQSVTGVFANLEDGGSHENPGWYNESSIYSIIYDIYDSNDDAGDTLSFGFTPIHKVLIDHQRNTDAFTSIFTFITGLKAQNPDYVAAIDAITSNEKIAPIIDIYGTGRTNRFNENANPLYSTIPLGGSVNFTTNYSATSTSSENRLGAYNFLKFTIEQSGTYTITISPLGGGGIPDPDMFLYTGASNQPIASATATGVSDSITARLEPGTYRLAAIVYDHNDNATFTVTLN